MTYGQPAAPQAPMSFADADSQNDFSELIPSGTLAFGTLNIKWFNADQGIIETTSKTSDARFLDCVITIIPSPIDGFLSPFVKRKVFTRIGTAGKEAYINMGRSAIKAILETGKNAGPNNPAGYEISSYADLDGLIVAFKVKEEPAKPPYGAKNDIALWLSPVDSVTEKDWKRLIANDVMPKSRPSGTAVAAPAAASWAGTPSTATAPVHPAPNGVQNPPRPAGTAASPANPLAKPAFLGGATGVAQAGGVSTGGWRPNQ